MSIPDIEFKETKELGRVNRVDPLGITYLRIRGMWGIENPLKVFNYVLSKEEKRIACSSFNLIAIINETKWSELPRTQELVTKIKDTKGANIQTIKIKDPNNPATLKNAYLITYYK